MNQAIFHLSFPVRCLAEARDFYCGVLGATVGRDAGDWMDVLLFGHQLTLHERPDEVLSPADRGVRHFGAILPWEQWQTLGARLVAQGHAFLMPPTVAKSGTDEEQGKMLLCDPSDNLVEIKAYRHLAAVLGSGICAP